MSDEPLIRDFAPTPIRRDRPRPEPGRPCSMLVGELRASLRATDAYLRMLAERLELACATDPSQLTRLHADFLVHVIAASDAFGDAAKHTLCHIEPGLARRVDTIADLARAGVGPSAPTTGADDERPDQFG